MSAKTLHQIALYMLGTHILIILGKQMSISDLTQKIIFDITKFEIFEQTNSTTITICQTNARYRNLDYLYFSIGYNNRNHTFRRHDVHKEWHINSSRIGYHKISGISFIVNSNNLLQNCFRNLSVPLSKEVVLEFLNSENNISALIFQVDPIFNEKPTCVCSPFSTGLKQLFQETLKMHTVRSDASPKFGVEYDEHLIVCCQNSLFSVLEILDLAVFVIHIKPVNILLSANLFWEHLKPTLIKNRKFVGSVNSNIKIMIRIKLSKNEDDLFTDNIYFSYMAHIKDYVEHWQKNDLFDELFILEFFPDTIKANTYSLQNVQPILLESTQRIAYHHMENYKSSCQNQYLIRTTYNAFDDFIFKPNNVESLKAMESECHKHLNLDEYRKFFVNSMSILISNQHNWEDILAEVVQQWKMKKGLKFETVFFKVSTSTLPGKSFSAQALHFGSYNNLVDSYILAFGQIGCYVQVDNVESAVSLCGPLFKRSSVLYIEWSLEESEIHRKLPKILKGMKEQQLIFAQKYPQHKLLVGLLIANDFSNKFDERTIKRSSVRQTIYCDVKLQKLYESYDAILTFAEIHKLGKIVLQFVVHTGHVGGWWNSVETLKSVNRTATDFPLLVQRNVPSGIANKLKLSNQFECIEWSENANENGIKFNTHNNFGGLINMKSLINETFRENELQTLLRITLSKFSFVEIIIGDINDLQMLVTSVNKASVESRIDIGYKYLAEMPFHALLSRNIFSPSDLKLSSIFGIHVYGWEQKYLADYEISQKFWNHTIVLKGIKFGISVSNCADEMNSNFIRIISFKLIRLLNYVVCNVSPIKPENHNKDKMQTFLDTQFYTQAYFKSFTEFQNVQIYFRLNFQNQNCVGKKAATLSYLRVVNDLNEHSKTYGVKYLLPTFENCQISDCPLAWWRVANPSDFANLSIYSERESEYFGRQTRLDLILNTTNINTKNLNTDTFTVSLTFIIIGVSLFVLSISVLFTAWYKLKSSRKRHLTNVELDIFRNGRTFEYDLDVCDLLDSLKFDSKFEIEKNGIEFQKRIGRGRFGHVYKSLLNNELVVAVKLPHNECLKESFMSMLIEVKILCYVGTHPFVVRFIGAYTEEIQLGKLYIVTEYCENGCLHSYLRDQRVIENKNKTRTEIMSVDISHLCLFSCQIAKGMAYIGEKNVVHGDLSARNILLTGDLVCKIGDFGLSRRLYENPEYVKKTKGPIPWRWLSIESLKNRTFTTKSDVWSFGVTVWEIFTYCDLPYPSKQLSEDFIKDLEDGFRLSKPQYATYVIHEKLLECWSNNPTSRPDFEQLAEFFNALVNVEYAS